MVLLNCMAAMVLNDLQSRDGVTRILFREPILGNFYSSYSSLFPSFIPFFQAETHVEWCCPLRPCYDEVFNLIIKEIFCGKTAQRNVSILSMNSTDGFLFLKMGVKTIFSCGALRFSKHHCQTACIFSICEERENV